MTSEQIKRHVNIRESITLFKHILRYGYIEYIVIRNHFLLVLPLEITTGFIIRQYDEAAKGSERSLHDIFRYVRYK